MPAASRVVLVPPDRWDEPRLLAAARALPRPAAPLRPGDDVGGLVVLRVEPGSALAPDEGTVFEVRGEPRTTRGPPHLAILLDASESMALPWSADDSRFDAARTALLDSLRGSVARLSGASVFVFAREVRLVAGPLTPEGMRDVQLDATQPKGPARTGAALDAALAHLAAQSQPPEQGILLLTDGIGDVAGARAAAARAARLRVPVHVVVFAPEADDALLDLARATGGTVQLARLPLGFDLPPRGT